MSICVRSTALHNSLPQAARVSVLTCRISYVQLEYDTNPPVKMQRSYAAPHFRDQYFVRRNEKFDHAAIYDIFISNHLSFPNNYWECLMLSLFLDYLMAAWRMLAECLFALMHCLECRLTIVLQNAREWLHICIRDRNSTQCMNTRN